MMEAEFIITELRAWINDIAQRYHLTVRIVDCIPWGERGGQAIFEIEGSQGRAPAIIRDIKAHQDITSISIDDPEGGRLRGTVGMCNCDIVRILLNSGCFLETATAEREGAVRFKVLVGAEGSLPDLFRKLSDMGMRTELLRLTRFNELDRITDKQEEVVRLALEKGYYDCPRKITMAELADLCDVSAPTIGEILKRGERNILRQYFEKRAEGIAA